jgi:hypothetical protein
MSVISAESLDFTSFDQVPWVLLGEIGGAFFRFAPDEDIHAALQCQHLPEGLARGTTAAESGTNLRNW